ncbi:integrase family protein [Lactobacillus selangorensis]|uniref:Integrase family protein n=1 Tax=Lactobacillus selangorensis TaxID=81857 RepID=A0A0R2FTR1_9LACO|nr:tyrosine-type recombinase/integrase [Lactobacillus selangorensis]KRN29204.1 integrase family protein [Lactobacillus selangorensis]KRN31438.1 integrase family protein [Lactobacillus selangorensis]
MKKHPGVYSYTTVKGTRYGVRRGFKNSEGKRDEFTRSGLSSWREADMVLKSFEAKIARGEVGTVVTGKISLDEWYGRVKKRNIELGVWRKSTVDSKDYNYSKHISPRFGRTALNDLNRNEYQRFIDGLIKQGFAYRTIVTIDSVTQMLLNRAENEDIIAKNKLRKIAIDGGKDPADQSLEVEEYRTYMETAEKMLDRYQIAILYMLTLGERREELCGLKYNSFEFSTDESTGEEVCAITFDEARTVAQPEGGPLKTRASYRTIYVKGDIIDLIRYAILTSKNICRKYHREVKDDSFLFVAEKTGIPIYPAYANVMMRRVSKACGIKVHPHMLRHYFATTARDDKLPSMAVMHWLGHQNISMTNSYTRPSKRGALKVIDGIQGTILDGVPTTNNDLDGTN